jgi:hypothetical protein
MYRPSSALGLEQPSDATGTPAPKPEKMSDVATTDMMPVIVPPKTSASADAEADRTRAGD